jgi:hypothetical protein
LDFEVTAEVPPRAGAVVAADWDFDGTGQFASPVENLDVARGWMRAQTQHQFDIPGTYFPSVRVRSCRNRQFRASSNFVENLARVRVVVK